MKLNKYFFSFMSAAMLLGVASCSDDEVVKNHVQPGDLVAFSIDQRASRTVYETGDQFQIDWLKGDGITIFCQQAEGAKNANYTITPTESDHKTEKAQSKYGIVDYNENGLCWNGAIINENPDHNFYAVYPAGVATSCTDAGVVELPQPKNQVCTVTGTADSKGQYVAAPDMKYAYMVAAKTGVKAGNIKPGAEGTIDLKFAPVMTTLDIVVSCTNTGNTGSDIFDLTGITVTMPNLPLTSSENFCYQAAEGKIVTEGTTTMTGSFVATLNTGSGNKLELKAGQSVKFTMFLPPVDINNANKINVRVNGNVNGNSNFKVTVGNNIAASTRRQINLPAINLSKNTDITPNNWISELDDNIYVNQLSIPGTNNSAAYQSFIGLATSQQSLDNQWNAGVRAFEFRTAVATTVTSHGAHQTVCYDAGTNLQLTFDEAMTSITNFLAANPKEFAVVVNSYQSQGNSTFKEDKSYWLSETKRTTGVIRTDAHGIPYYMKNWASKQNADGKSWFVDFKPDMTIGEARGRIILVNFDEYDNMKGVLVDNAQSPFENGNDFSIAGEWRNFVGHTNGRMFIQNMFGANYQSDDAKLTGIKTADAIAANLSNSANFDWVLNYVGGASTGSLNSTNSYRATAAVNNKAFNEWLINPARPVGPTGIVMVSFQGVERAGETDVYGANLPMTIISNNFKFTMKRKK